MTDDEIWNLKRGGHDYRKLYAAYKAATEHTGQPTVILAKTIKGWTLGSHFEGRNATHQMKKLTLDDLKSSATGSTWTSRTRRWRRTRTCRRTTTRARSPTRSQYMQERRAAARRLPAVAADHAESRWRSRAGDASPTSSAAPASRRSPPRWRSSGCSRT